MYRTIRADKIISTAEQLVARVRETFPDSGGVSGPGVQPTAVRRLPKGAPASR